MSDVDRIGTVDHECQEYRIFGPPGTGKTTSLSRQIGRAAAKFGSESVLVTSFSKTAAAELVGRNLPIPKANVGTLHSHCYRAIGSPVIAETKVEDWNTEHPNWQVTGKSNTEAEEGLATDSISSSQSEGDGLLAHMGLLRNRCVPENLWPAKTREFAAAWSDWKQANGLMDFCDLIETCARDTQMAPGNPNVIVVDEAQDMSILQMNLVRRWGRYSSYFIISADDDQCIFTFTGASPEAVIGEEIPEENNIFLRQSYRVPRAVHAAATNLIKRVGRRKEKEYYPRDFEGKCSTIRSTYTVGVPHMLDQVERRTSQGKSCMILASCSYMLQEITHAMRAAAIPFHNPYARERGHWNPLTPAAGTSTAHRILSLLRPHPEYGAGGDEQWHGRDVRRWAENLKVEGCFKRGAKQHIAAFPEEDPVKLENLMDWFDEEALRKLLGCFEGNYRQLLDWWVQGLTNAKMKSAEFPARVANRDIELLKRKPQVIVGTIHSVKGGEADCVFLFPDLSMAGANQFYNRADPESRDQIIRLMYVGMTRAREEFLLCLPNSPSSVPASFFC